MDERTEGTGVYLLQKSKRGILKMVFSRIGLIVVLLVLQVLYFFSVFLRFQAYLPQISVVVSVFTLGMLIHLFNSKMNPTAKITWLVLISVAPLFGALLLLYTQINPGHRAIKRQLRRLIEDSKENIRQDPEVFQKLQDQCLLTASLARYIAHTGDFPVYDETDVTYFPMGEDKFTELLCQLELAQHFIFLEYFIIDEGEMWGKILEILARKVKEGVEVRVMYDGTNEFTTLPHDYPKRLQLLGIQCKVFAPFTPFLSTHYNYRDHRKILVIDGHTAFTGGINLADEYINKIKKYGHWKDTAIMLKGKAVSSFTLMFLQMWNYNVPNPEFGCYIQYPTFPNREAEGFVIPYADSPLDEDKVGERVYMDILNRSERYVHIMSPYLILDGEMEVALKFAAERGIDVRLILPGIPDKKTPYALAKTHYASLLESGVRIYEYTPGFVHAKVFVSDDCKAVVGTINLDYRSLYHHFECAAYLYRVPCITDIEADFQETLTQCREVTRETIKKEKLSVRFWGKVLKIFAPLM